MMISCIIIFRIRNVWGKILDKTKAHILRSVIFFFSKNRAVYERIWKKNMVEPDRPQMTI